MKKILLGVLFCCFWQIGFGQIGQWTWMGGDTTKSNQGVYGVKGVSSQSNKPGGRFQSVGFADTANNFWLFGGSGYSFNRYGYLNDLWKYNTTTKEWTWMKGSDSINSKGFYGIQGIASASNEPPSVFYASSWTDLSGNLWSFGGQHFNTTYSNNHWNSNDLWKYDVLTNAWTWMKGDSTVNSVGNYGIKNVASPANMPPAREMAYNWRDKSGNPWLFGGGDRNLQGMLGHFGDLWKYTLATNEWTWMSGDATTNAPAIYGTQGIADPANTPGGREWGMTWTDTSGNLWLFGGGRDIVNNLIWFNDLWKYDVAINQWIWVSGDITPNNASIYNTLGVASPTSKPGSRAGCNAWTDFSGNLWLSQGAGYAKNDIWKYEIATNQWAWMRGNRSLQYNGTPRYGIQEVSTAQNDPGYRYNSAFWKDKAGVFWLFGGAEYNDLWRYIADTSYPLHLLTFTAKRANTVNLLNWTTTQEVNTDRFEIERSPAVGGSREFSKIGSVKAGNTSYTFTDNNPLKAVNYYRLKMVDKDGKFEYSPIRMINNNGSFSVNIYPNPAKDKLQLQIDCDKKVALKMDIITQNGRVVLSSNMSAVEGSIMRSINIAALQRGTYFLRATSGSGEQSVVKFEKAQ